MSNWHQIELGDYIEIITDYHANGAYEKLKENITLKYVPDYAIMVRTLNFESNDFKDKMIYLNEFEYNYLSKSKVQPYDIIMNKIANAGSVYLMPNLNKPVSLAMNLFLIRFNKKIDQRFVYYLMKFNEDYIKKFATGTATKSITKDAVRALKFNIPNLSYQKKTSSFLSNIDAKIELNKRINSELEAMAKTLYDYWFVQFDFPDANGKPYKSSGGKMVWNEELKREIPEGWEVKKTEDLVADIKTGLNPRKHFKLGGGLNYYITIKNIEYGRISFDNNCDRIDDDAMDRIQKRSNLEKGDILFTSIEPVGKTYLLSEKPINWNINESVFSFKPNYDLVSSEYLFMLLSSKGFNDLCKNASTGSIHKGIRITPMKAFKICHPNNKNLIIEFTKIVSPYLKFIDKNQKENQELSSLRDWLLPMLMNGQVKVVDAQEMINNERLMVADPTEIYEKVEKELVGKVKKTKTTTIKLNPVDVYKRTLLAAEIVFQLKDTYTLGHLKLQKMLYLCQEIENMALPMNFLKQAMGPYDNQLARSLDKQFETKKWFKYQREASLKYVPLEKSGQHRDDFDKYFENQLEGINYLIKKFTKFTSTQIEAVATLYACWKEAIENNEIVNDKLIIIKFYNWSKEKEKFQEENLVKALDWMRRTGIEPSNKKN